MVELTKDRFKWVWARANEPKRLIAALELLALVFLQQMMLALSAPSTRVATKLPTSTDNQGNSYALLRQYSRKLPAALVHMELAMMAHRENFQLEVSFLGRDQNTWADQLSNLDPSGFDVGRQWIPSLGKGCFMVLDDLLSAAGFRQE